MAEVPSILSRDFGKKTVSMVLAVVGLLVLRAFVGLLPVLTIGDSLMSPAVIAKGLVDTLIIAVVLSFGLGVAGSVRENNWNLPDLSNIVSLATLAIALGIAYNAYQTPVACSLFTPADLFKTNLPQSTDEALRKLGLNWAPLQAAYQQLAGQQVKTLTGDNVEAFQQLAVLRLTEAPNIYGWVFLALIVTPVVGMAVLVARNLDAMADLLFHKTESFFRQASRASAGPKTGAGQRTSRPGAAGISAEDVETLTKLKSLLDSGLISKEDFDDQKKKILGLTGTDHATPEGIEELRKLKELLDAGALTQEEYEIQKQRFLAGS